MKTILTLLLILSFALNYILAQPVMGTTSANGVNIIYQDGFNATSLQTTAAPYDVTKWQRTNGIITLNTTHNWAGTVKGYETGSTHMISFNAGSTGHYLWSPVINLPASNNLFARIAVRYPSTENISGGGVLTFRVAIDTDNDLSPNGSTYSTVISGASNPYNDAASGTFFPNMTHKVRYLYLDLSQYNAGGNTRIGIYIQQTASALLSPPVYLDWFEVGTRPTNDLCANAINLVDGVNGGVNGFYNTTASGLTPSTNASPVNNQGGSVVYIGPGTNGTGSIPTDGTRIDGYQPASPGPLGTTGQTVENSTWYKFTTPPDPLLCGQAPGAPLSVRLTFTNLSCASTLTNIPAQVQFRTFNTGLCGTNSAPSALHITQTVSNNGNFTVTGLSYSTEYYLMVDGVYANDCKFNITTETFINGISQPSNPCVILPIELTHFNASAMDNNYVQIDWTTATERNNDYFSIERSTDGITFDEIATVNGAINSTEELNYTTYDYNPNYGFNYYRLSQTDTDGKKKTFNIVAAKIGNDDEFQIVPNPNNGRFLIISKNEYKNSQEIKITDIEGRVVYNDILDVSYKEAGIEVNLPKLVSGTYIVSISSENSVSTSKIMIK